jgi:ABC-2 type transport system permease protein
MKEINLQNNLRLKSWLQFLSVAAGLVLIASAGSLLRLRLDLTEDKRYTLSFPTREVLSAVKKDIYIQVWLDGEMPIPLKKLKRTAGEMLDEFRLASGKKIDFEFINPSDSKDAKKRQSTYQSLIKKGLIPVNIQAGDAEGGSMQKIIFPGMIINCNGVEVPVNFLKNNPNLSYEQNILHSEEGLEYELIQNIATLSSDTIYKVAFIEGHGEIPETETADLTLNMARFFTIDRGVIGGKPGILDQYAAVIIAGPENEFNESDKLVLDQYIMNGGKVLWLFDEVKVNADSLAFGETVGLYRTLNIEDQIFMYGARVNPSIVQDLECQIIRMKVGTGSTNQQIVSVPWVYYPLLIPSASHPVTRNLNRVKGEFVNYIDTVGLDTAIRKTILLSTSKFSRTLSPPLMINLKEAELPPDEKLYNKSGLPVAVLLEGVFPSAFRNRAVSNLTADRNLKIRTESKKTRLIVIADADIIRNEVRRVGLEVNPLPLGQDKYTGQMFGNRDFLLNCLNYLVDDHGLMELRSREVKLRLLDKIKVKSEKMKWQLINVLGPVLIVILAGVLYNYLRRMKFTKIR